MAWPAEVVPITIHGRIVLADEAQTPAAGKVYFKMPFPLRDTEGAVVLAATVFEATLDVLGEFTIDVPATDAPLIVPQDWTYRVRIATDKLRQVFNAMVPFDSLGGALELADMVPAESIPATVLYALKNHNHYQVVPLVDGPTIEVDASLANNFSVTLAGNRVLGNPIHGVNGQKLLFAFRQDNVGSRLLTLGSDYRLGTDIPVVNLSLAPNKTDYLGVRYNATDAKWDVMALAKGY